MVQWCNGAMVDTRQRMNQLVIWTVLLALVEVGLKLDHYHDPRGRHMNLEWRWTTKEGPVPSSWIQVTSFTGKL
jgi:predicted oxidoreductase (fatty acid repression mutant protein)